MCYENDADVLLLQIPHEIEKLLYFLIVKRRRRLVQNQYLALHVDGPRNRDHLLHGKGAASEKLRASRRNSELCKDFVRPFLEFILSDPCAPASSDEHVLRHRQVRAKGYFLIYRTDSGILGVLRGMDGNLLPFHADFAAVHLIYTGQHLDEGGFSGAVLSHKRMDLPFTKREIHPV